MVRRIEIGVLSLVKSLYNENQVERLDDYVNELLFTVMQKEDYYIIAKKRTLI